MQTRLLRFIQEGTIRRVGDNRERTLSCRIVAATNANLPQMVRNGDFREDLYYRLKVVTLSIPPLRDRKEDIPILTSGFIEDLCKEQKRPVATITPDAMGEISNHTWPGNVRELRNTIEAVLVFCQGDTIEVADLNIEEPPIDSPAITGQGLSLEDNEKDTIIKALKHCKGVKKDAADTLGISRRAIHYKIKKYGIGDPDDE